MTGLIFSTPALKSSQVRGCRPKASSPAFALLPFTPLSSTPSRTLLMQDLLQLGIVELVAEPFERGGSGLGDAADAGSRRWDQEQEHASSAGAGDRAR